MKILLFSSDEYVKEFFNSANKQFKYRLNFSDLRLNRETVSIAQGYSIISCFIYDNLSSSILKALDEMGVKMIALRSVGYNNVDVETAKKLNITVTHVPDYSPYAVAEHAVALVLSLNRKTHKAYIRVRDNNFSLHSLIGFDLHGSTVGVIGVGKIGAVFARIMHGFGCRILAYDKMINKECQALGVEYVSLNKLLSQSEIISLHCPLTPKTHYLINPTTINLMQKGVMLINTSRGGLVDTKAVVKALKSGKIGYLGLDVYEEERNLFFSDLSESIIDDDLFSRLQTFPNVLITSHQAFLTKQAYVNIANTTLQNVRSFVTKKGQLHSVL